MTCPLYIKTDNSLLESLIKIDDLIEFANKHNIKALTITDNFMYGVLEFYIKCKKNNIKPIIGLEIFDIVLYAKNFKGYQNLIKLSTIKSKEEINLDILKQYSSDLICIVPFKNNNFEDFNFYENIYKGYTSLDEKRTLSGNKVYLNEVLYLDEKDNSYLKYLLAIKNGILASDINLDKKDNHFFNYKIYEDETLEEIINLCNVEIPFNQDLLPIYNTPNGIDSYSYLKELVINGLKSKFGTTVNKIYLDRIKYELDIINKMGFCNYFLVVWDYVNFARNNNILTGPGRGSAAGSLISYLIGITGIDPIKYDLLFERFLNLERISMPDIDIDFEDTRRDEVIKYCIDKYGIKKVAPIITFGTLGSKQVIRDVSKSLNIDSKDVDKITKMLDSRFSLIENYQNNIKLKEFILKDDNLKKLYKISLKLEGLKRHTSIHAAGVVMSKQDLDDIIPLSYHDSFYTTGYSMEYLEELGLLKMDLLAIKNLNLINNILKELDISFSDIPLNDKDALDIFSQVDTIGIFQFESSGMMNFLKKFKITSFDDIVAAIALFRPGPMGNIDSYIKRKEGKEEIDYIHPDLKDILKSTYGIIIYQEQIMQIANKLASYSLSEADLLRKAMSKKKEDILLSEKDKFVSKCISNGYSKDIAIKVYELILKFASYGFNKAHSVSYAMIAYKMAYLKAHHYNIYIKNLLSMVIGSEIKTKEYINSSSDKISVIKPNINNSGTDYKVYNDSIIYPLTCIKNVGLASANAIIEKRGNTKFSDIFDFFARCYSGSVNIKVIESLNKAGCFEDFINQKTLDNNLELLTNYSELGSLLEDSLKPVLTNYSEYSKEELLKREIEVFGFYLSEHPITSLRKKYKSINLTDIEKYYNNLVTSLIYVEKTNKIKTKNNENMVFITGSDETGSCEFVLFPKNYQEIKASQIYLINGKVEKRFEKLQIIINKIEEVFYE